MLASAPCNNRENCIPVSLYDDAAWHTVEVSITPLANFGATVSFSLDNGAYSGFGQVQYGFFMPSPTYLGFSARTGGATNNQYAIYDCRLQTIILTKYHCCCSWVKEINYGGAWVFPPPPPPPPPLPNFINPASFALSGSTQVVGETIQLVR